MCLEHAENDFWDELGAYSRVSIIDVAQDDTENHLRKKDGAGNVGVG